MVIWTKKAKDVLCEATAKANAMNHQEVLPLHLLWALTCRTGIDALQTHQSDERQARLRFQLEKDLSKLLVRTSTDDADDGKCAAPGTKMQRLLLRAADHSLAARRIRGSGRVGLTELIKALLPDDHRATGLLRSRNEYLAVSA